jgi:pimeloyl-ACP methyl ester carboxylesterase
VILAHDDSGTGDPVLLLHAGVADRRMWDPLVPVLSHTFRVIRPDLRGFGDSAQPGEEYADADDLDVLLDSLGVGSASVVGSSYGGRVAMELATAHPGRVSSLVLLCPAFRGLQPSEEDAPALEAYAAHEGRLLESGDIDAAVELTVATWVGPEADPEVRDLVAAMQRHAYDVQLAAERQDPPPSTRRIDVDPSALAVDTLMVSGAHDLGHFRAIARHLAEQVPGAEHMELDWAGHLPSLERPDAVLALLLDVLRDDPAVHAP